MSLDWLQRNDASWNFNSDLLTLNGLQVKLQTLNDKTACTRCTQVAADTNIPARHRVCILVRLKHILLPAVENEVWLSETKTVHNSLITVHSVTNANVEKYLDVVNPTFRDVKIGRGANLGVAVKLAVMNSGVTTNHITNTNAIFAVATDGDQTKSLGRKKMVDDDSVLVRTSLSPDEYSRPAEARPTKSARHDLSTILETSHVSDGNVTTVGSNFGSQDATNEDQLRQTLVNKILYTITLPLTKQERARVQALLTEYKYVFAIHDFDCGLFKDFVCDVTLIHSGVRPIADKVRRYPL